MNDTYLRRIYMRLAGVIMIVVVLALAATATLSHRAFEHALAPELARKAATVGATIRSLMLKAHDNNVPLKDLFGMEQVFEVNRLGQIIVRANVHALPNVANVAFAREQQHGDSRGRVMLIEFLNHFQTAHFGHH